MNTSRLTF